MCIQEQTQENTVRVDSCISWVCKKAWMKLCRCGGQGNNTRQLVQLPSILVFFLSRPGLPVNWLSLIQLDLLLESPRDAHVSASEVLGSPPWVASPTFILFFIIRVWVLDQGPYTYMTSTLSTDLFSQPWKIASIWSMESHPYGIQNIKK